MPDAQRNYARMAFCLLPVVLVGCAGYSGVRAPQLIQEQQLAEEASLRGNETSLADTYEVQVPEEAVLSGEVDDQVVFEKIEDSPGALTERVLEERETAFNPYVLTAHKHNFILPVSYSNGINEEIYKQNDVPLREGLQPAEVKFQISLKTQLNEQDLMFANDALSVGITLEAWWQLYSSDLSSPFRETNYQPEIFYLVPLLWGPFGGSTALVAGLEHQSNGQVQGLSRSWNRLYTVFIYEKGNFVGSLRPWYRLPEKSKKSPEDPDGDDNPDIENFMGHAELNFSWRDKTYEYGALFRSNPRTGKGAVKLGVTFPLFAKFRGFVQYFSGYGDSLIDYDHYQQRIGLGVALTNLF
ncbi:MAG: phospholipase A [Granulosicoccus sp.]